MPGLVVFAAAIAALQGGPISLGESIGFALASFPGVKLAQANRDRADAEVGDARSATRPRVSLDASLSQFQEPMVVAPLHGFDPRNPPLFDRSLVQTGVTVGWAVYDFGQRAARISVQQALSEGAGAAVTTAERQVIARTINAYVRLLVARGVTSAHRARLAALDTAAARVRQLLAQGKAARVAELRMAAEMERARAEQIATDAQLQVATLDLGQMTGLYTQALNRSFVDLRLVDADIDRLLAPRADSVLESLYRRAGSSNSASDEEAARVRAAAAGLTAARTLRFPEIRATGAVLNRGRVEGDFGAEWQLGVTVSYPLYTGGSRTHLIERAAAEATAAQARAALFDRDVESNLDRALASLREAHGRTAALESAERQSTEVARIEALSMEVGSGTQSEFLDAQATLLRVRASLVESRYAELLARVEIARLTGELTRDWVARHVRNQE